MTPVIPCSTSSTYLIPGTAFTIKKHNHLKNGSLSRKSTRHTLSLQRLVLPLPSSVTVLPQYRSNHALLRGSLQHVVSATGTDVAVEEADSPVANEDSGGASVTSADAGETSEKPAIKSEATPAPGQSRRSRPTRKSEMPPVKDEDLVPGATFTGKVRSIQPFGAFVDFGAFTDGLVHVSRMSESFVKDVGEIVSVGQEVKVRVVEANTETGRISLTMRESDDINKLQRKDSTTTETGDKPRPARRNTSKPGQRREESKSSKFVRGQDLEGTVKNLTRAGAFISLPEGEEGFLPTAEEADDGIGTMMGGSSLSVGQEVSVRVLRIGRGQVTLTMKKEEDGKLDMELNQGVVHSATNAFVFAFRKNKEIASFLDEREKVVKAMEESVKPEPSVEIEKSEATSDPAEVQDQLVSSDDVSVSVPPTVTDTVEGEETSKELAVEATVASDVKEVESVESIAPSLDGSAQTIEKGEESSVILDPEGSLSTAQQITEESPPVNGKPDSTEEIASEVLSPENLVGEKVIESKAADAIANDEVQIETPSAESEISSNAPTQEDGMGAIPEENGSIQGSVKVESTENSDPSESQTVEEVGDNQVGVGSVEYADPSEATDEIQEPSSESQGVEVVASKATISPALVKKLREETGAGMMDCKKALSETGGDIIKAQEFLRKKGLASADKKASRATAEGRIGSYIHDSRIGVLIEVNCETDFVSRGDIFKELVDDLAMQVAACPQVQYLAIEDVPEEIVNKEKEIEMQKEDLLSKPEQFRSKIVEGRIRKRLEELALLEQPYIKNDKVVVKDLVKQTIATIGENMKVKRFVRYNLGEGLEKKSQDFAAEVAAQTAAKTEPTPAKEQPAAAEAKETTPKPPAVAVSAALVKQLREETGAGMMDCKKALSETGGDLEKAQEYLRKKGLSTADKKSSRLAAEGRIGSYIHDARIGVMIEVNSETDFVGRSEKFKELVDDLAMQVAACPQVQYVTIEDIPESIRNKEKELEMQREDLLSKPENIREKIVEGRVSKRLGELVLLEQPYIKDDSLLVKDLVKQTVAALEENLKVRRFVRFTLGESTDA